MHPCAAASATRTLSGIGGHTAWPKAATRSAICAWCSLVVRRAMLGTIPNSAGPVRRSSRSAVHVCAMYITPSSAMGEYADA